MRIRSIKHSICTGKSKSGFERTAVSNFKSKKHEGSGNELVDLFQSSVSSRLVLTKRSIRRHVGSGNEIAKSNMSISRTAK